MPEGFIEAVNAILYPGQGDGAVEAQYERLMDTIDAVEALVAKRRFVVTDLSVPEGVSRARAGGMNAH